MKSPKMMGVIVTVCAAFGLTVSEAKTEITCFRQGGCRMPPPHSASRLPARYTNKRTISYTSGGTSSTTPTWPSRSTGEYTTPGAAVEVFPRTVRPTERRRRAQDPDAESRSTRDNAVQMCHVEPARVPLRHAAQSPPRLADPLYRMAKAYSHRPPDLLPRNPCEDGSESIEAILCKRWILFVESVARMEDTRLPKCVMFGGCGL